jgi:uncharacterized phage-associated protein
MPYRPDAIANFFITEYDPVASGLTPMKLQKLVYFAHGWYLALKDEPLIADGIQAWQYGPVIVKLYHKLKEHQNSPVTEPIVEHDLVRENGKPAHPLRIATIVHSLDDLPSEKPFVTVLLQRIWNIYGQHDAIQLSKMTHEEGSPWDQTLKKFGGRLPQNAQIPNEIIRDFFRKKREENLAKATSA